MLIAKVLGPLEAPVSIVRVLIICAIAFAALALSSPARAVGWTYSYDTQADALQHCLDDRTYQDNRAATDPNGPYHNTWYVVCEWRPADADHAHGYYSEFVNETATFGHYWMYYSYGNHADCVPPNVPQADGSCLGAPPPPPPVCRLPQILLPNGTCGIPPGDPNKGSPKCGAGNPINCATGNKYQRESDVVVSPLLRFERHYNSAADSPSNLLGPHWTNTFYRRVDVVDSSNVVVFREDGAGFKFTLSGSAWTAPVGIFSTLIRSTDGNGNLTGWVFKQEDGREVENFDALGRLTSIVRTDGQSVSLVYNSGVVENGPNDYLPTSVTAQDGRIFSLLYDSNHRLVSLTDPSGAQISYAYDSAGRLQTVTYPGGASKTYSYNEAGYSANADLPMALTGIVDEKGQRYASFYYQADGRAVSTEHAGGVQKYVLAYDDTTGVSSVTKPSGAVQQRGFDRSKPVYQLSSTSESANGQVRTTSQTFDASGNPDIATDALGTTTDSDYNARGLETQRIEAANVAATKRTVQTDWDATFNVPTARRVLNSAGVLESNSTWTYNSRGQVLTANLINLTNSALTRTTTYSYCEQAGVAAGTCPIVGLLLRVDGPRTDVSDITTFTYYQADDSSCASTPTSCSHRKGDLWKVTNALGRVTETLTYDGARRPLSVKDPNGVVTDLEYNGRGWLTAQKVRGRDNASETDDAITRLEYDNTGSITKTIQPDGAFIAFTYDAAHRLTDVTDALGNSVHYSLNNSGQRIQEDTKNSALAVKRTLSRVFDTLGQLQTVADAQATPTDLTYDLNGQLDTAHDPLGRITDNTVDALGRLVQVIANTGGTASDKATSQFQYDARDNLRAVIDPKGLSTNYTYDSLGNLTQISSPDTGSTIYGYDLAGNRTSEMKADNVTQGNVFDALGRLTGQTFAHAAQNVTLTYDTTQADCASGETFSVGHLTKVTDASGSTRYCYDQRGHLVRAVQTLASGTTLTVGTTYNGADRLAAMTYPSGAIVTYVRDANGRVTSIALNGQTSLVSNATYLPFGPLNTLTFGNSRVLTKSYDQNYGIDSVIDSAAGSPLSEDFTLNAAGSVTGLSEKTGAPMPVTRTFTYDGLDRLTAQKNGATTVESFAYNSTGDRTSKTVGSATGYTYETNSHRLTAVGKTSRTYLPAGETLLNGSGNSLQTFAYDDNHRLSTFKLKTTLKLTNQYNGLGQRVAKISATSGNSRQFVYDETGHLLGEYTTTGTRVREYVWMDDTLVAVLGSYGTSAYQFVETDHLGTPRAVVNPGSNAIVWRWDVNPTAFGEHAPNENPDGDSLTYNFNLRFPGQYYDSESGLNYNYFRDYDPQTGRYIESDPIGFAGGTSTYAYAGSNSLLSGDPLGLWPSMFDYVSYTHQDAIRDNVPVSGIMLDNMLYAQEYADSAPFQTGENSFRHGMRDTGQSACEARALAEAFVRQQMEWALYNKGRGLFGPAAWEFGMALHTLQDSTSPTHKGFQQWGDDPGFWRTAAHVNGESNPAMYSSSDKEALGAMTRQAWGWYSSGNLPGKFFSGPECGCTRK